MKHHYAIALVLSLCACKKDPESDPKPALEGRWAYVKQTETLHNWDNQILGQSTQDWSNRGYAELTKNTWKDYAPDGTPVSGPPYTYTRNVNTIRLNLPSGTWQYSIVKLTEHELHLQRTTERRYSNANSNTSVYTDIFSR
ncbi:hypothetical protein GCM10027048_39090 [Hymenobacter coalescens]